MTVADTVTLDWTNNAYDGDELLEIFRRLTTGPGPWAKVKTVLHNGAASQSAAVNGLERLTEYDFAIRSQRGGLFRPGWESANPSLWDDSGLEAGAMVSAVATSALAPVPIRWEWERLDIDSDVINLEWEDCPADCQIIVERNLDGGGYVEQDSPDPGEITWQYFITGGGGGAGQLIGFRFKFRKDGLDGEYSDPVFVYGGPAAPTLLGVSYLNRNATDDGVTFYDEWGFVFDWPAGSYQGVQEIEVEVDEGGGGFVNRSYLGDGTRPDGNVVVVRTDPYEYCGLGPQDARIRAKQTAFTTVDYSNYSTIADAIECAAP